MILHNNNITYKLKIQAIVTNMVANLIFPIEKGCNM